MLLSPSFESESMSAGVATVVVVFDCVACTSAMIAAMAIAVVWFVVGVVCCWLLIDGKSCLNLPVFHFVARSDGRSLKLLSANLTVLTSLFVFTKIPFR